MQSPCFIRKEIVILYASCLIQYAMTLHFIQMRDVQGHEIDVIIEKSYTTIVPVEVKASMTIAKDFFKGIVDWQIISGQPGIQPYVVYGGNENLIINNTHIITWQKVDSMLEKILL